MLLTFPPRISSFHYELARNLDMQEPKKMVNVAVKASALLVVASFTFCAGKVSSKLIMEARNPRWEGGQHISSLIQSLI